MVKQIECPNDPTSHNLAEIGDLLNGKEGEKLQQFANDYKKIREDLLLSCDSHDSIYDSILEYVKKNPYTTRRKDKKKSRMQFLFEESHYPHQRPVHGPDHPVNVRDTKQPWNMNPGRLFIPKYVGDRMREVQWAQQAIQAQQAQIAQQQQNK
ncbi:unnamed protein product [Blepharisma stoltei]|uniref:Uncharacterized protein n=1 Tax=Blepharisma stoltei TaxID=1481888 RepID=A0AAU9IXB1_9CILI|nr:unnamed protein product [Blepharisma stoltei]